MSDFSYQIADLREIAYTFSQTVCALARIEAMKALNAERAHRGEVLAYDEAAFEAVPVDFSITHNQVLMRMPR